MIARGYQQAAWPDRADRVVSSAPRRSSPHPRNDRSRHVAGADPSAIYPPPAVTPYSLPVRVMIPVVLSLALWGSFGLLAF